MYSSNLYYYKFLKEAKECDTDEQLRAFTINSCIQTKEGRIKSPATNNVRNKVDCQMEQHNQLKALIS